MMRFVEESVGRVRRAWPEPDLGTGAAADFALTILTCMIPWCNGSYFNPKRLSRLENASSESSSPLQEA